MGEPARALRREPGSSYCHSSPWIGEPGQFSSPETPWIFRNEIWVFPVPGLVICYSLLLKHGDLVRGFTH